MSETTNPRELRRQRRAELSGDPGPDLPSVDMHRHSPREPGIGVVTKNERCTRSRKAAGFVRHVELDITGSQMVGKFRAGQSFGVLPPGADSLGRPHKVRLYSLACPTAGEDGNGAVIATTVKRTIDEHWETGELFLGVASNYLADLKVGDEVRITGPVGKRFLLPERPDEHDYVFIATGTGIAPFRGMIHDLIARGVSSRIVLIMGAPYATDLLYDDEFAALDAERENFHYLTAISREQQEDHPGTLYAQDRLETHRDLIVPLLADDRALVYVCGIAGMELGIMQKLTEILPPDRLQRYLRAEPEVLADVSNWTRQMIQREVHPSRRVFLEVY